MTWSEIAAEVWRFRPWMVPVLAALYAVPIARLITYPCQYGGRIFMYLNRLAGRWEHAVSFVRDRPVALYLAGGFFWHTWIGIETGEQRNFIIAIVCVFLVVLSFLNRVWKRSAYLRLMEFVEFNPTIHPQEFFNHLICSSGAIRHEFSKAPFRTIDPANLDFRGKHRSKGVGLSAMVNGAWSTIWLARLVLMAKRFGGEDFMRRVASSLAVIWATRIAQLTRAAITVEGTSRLAPAGGFQIYLFTHMSFLDFALAPLVLASRPNADEDNTPPHCLPHFLLAKDHFRDNPIFYRVLGIGRVAEALGMIFVDRSKRGEHAAAQSVVCEAKEKLLGDELDLAIYPQGSRSIRYTGATGERRDSGYYTVGSRDRIKADGKHLKKGAAYIATDAAIQIAHLEEDDEAPEIADEVRLVPVAISGTGISCPRGCMRILPGIHMRLFVGEPIVIDTAMISGITSAGHNEYADFVGRIHRRIDLSLKGAARIHAELERRFFEDMRGMLDPLKIEEIAIAMKPWRGDDYLVHAILDAIYACPPKFWHPFIGELVHHILNFAPRDELLKFKGRVADALSI